ncbi:MAG: ROK family protein [Victivallales bacterium]
MAENEIILGYDVGGTKLGIGLASSNGKILGKDRIENKDTYPEDILPQMAEKGRRLVAAAGLKMSDVKGFGISAPGPADIANGVLTAPTNNVHWRNVPIQSYLENELQIKGCFENDANCAALAEWFFGAGRGCHDFIYLTMSTGIGGGIVTNDTLVRGTGFYGGEVGHVVIEANDGRLCGCGHHGCYEAYCGGRSVALYIQRLLKDQPDHPIVQFAGGKVENIDMIALEKAVRANDALALEIWEEIALRNAQAFGMLMNTFNPKRLILGTFGWAIGELYTEPIKKYLPRFAWAETLAQCEIVSSELRRDMGYYAGAAAAMYFLLGKRA